MGRHVIYIIPVNRTRGEFDFRIFEYKSKFFVLILMSIHVIQLSIKV